VETQLKALSQLKQNTFSQHLHLNITFDDKNTRTNICIGEDRGNSEMCLAVIGTAVKYLEATHDNLLSHLVLAEQQLQNVLNIKKK
jgi:hypothetical protein